MKKSKSVPCDGCAFCCRDNTLIVILRELGDRVHKYKKSTMTPGGLVLNHKANGDCAYLDRKKGCTIYKDRPVMCQEFDCRVVLAKHGKSALSKGYLTKDCYKAACKRVQSL